MHLGCFHFVTIKKYCYELTFQIFCEHLFSFLLDIYLRVELLNCVVILCLTFWEPNCFPNWLYYITFPPTMYEVSSFSTSSPVCYVIILVIAFLVHLKCHIIVIMVCISLMIKWCWASLHVLIGHILVYPLWRNVYPLPIFKLGCLFIEL